MSDVIDLCSSSSDEEGDVQVVTEPVAAQSKLAAARHWRSKPVTPDEDHRKQPFMDDGNNSSGSSSTCSSEYRSNQKPKKARRQLNFDFLNEDDSSDDELLRSPIFGKVGGKKGAAKSKPKENLKVKPNNAAIHQVPGAQASIVGQTTISAPAPAVPNKPPVLNPYTKRPPTVPAASSTTVITYPNPANQTYQDLRPQYILAFWKHAQTLVHASYNLGKLDRICRRIVDLSFSEFPIRSQEEYCQRLARTSGDVASSILDILKNNATNQFPPHIEAPTTSDDEKHYVSIPEACLVAMLEHVESIAAPKDNCVDDLKPVLSQKDYWIALSDLLPMIDCRLKTSVCPGRLAHSNQPDNGAAHYLEPSTRSAEFKQIEKLQSKSSGKDDSYIKSHRQKKLVYYELTKEGYDTAKLIRQRTFPSPRGHYRTSNLSHVEPKFQDICLAVDRREGGGPKKQLHYMCNKLDTLKIPYFVQSLDIGDYCLFTSDGTNLLLPVLVERKSVQDVAASIFDGRWTNQKRRMYQGQYVFGHSNCRMAYIIEGNKESQQLTGEYIGERRFQVTREQLDQEIENLEAEGFEVLRTLSPDHSMVEISRWATRVRQDFVDGKLRAQYTYEEFLCEVNKIPRNTDFSKIAKDRAIPKKKDPPKQSTENKGTKIPMAQRKLDFGSVASTKTARASSSSSNNYYNGMSVKELKEKCEEYGLAKTGKKADLIARLNGPKPPKLWLDRKARKVGFVPSRYNTCATALLVGLYLEQRKDEPGWTGLTKDDLYPLAESLRISKDPFSGVPTGPFKYDGWSSMSDLRQGEIPLVRFQKGRFLLTKSTDVSGYPLAQAMHRWCHEHNVCACQDVGYNGDV